MTGLPASVAAAVLLVATLGAAAQDIDYDPRRPQELRPCDEHMHRGRINEARECYALLLSSQDSVTHAEAAWALGDLRTANELLRRSVRLDEQAVQPRSRWARLFLQTHQYADAIKLFREALEISPDDVHAKLGLAQVFAERFEGQAKTLLQEVLGQDDQLLGAQLLAARMALEEGQFEQADKALDAAARIASRRELPPLEVYSLRAALELSRERSPDAWIDRALAYNPRYGAVFQELAHFEVMRRRYAQASVLLRRAIEVQPELWSAHAELGSNLLRLGELAQARSHLTKAYSGDPYSPTIVNSLRLLDRIGEFELISEPVYAVGRQFEVKLRLHRSEAAALRPYVMELASKGVQQFSQRYGFTLHEPVTLELYPDHDDFAVRVAALPGIGLLGVTFGYVVAMDSPSGRPSGEFHWGGTLWHELAHVFTLEATGHRVPRWLSEGLSVFEEWRTGPAPGVAVTMDAIAALRDKRFLPIDELDSGFIRPSYPGQVQVSYMQAGLICLFIDERWGFEKLTALLQQFTRKGSTGQAVEAVLRISPKKFDEQFDEFARLRFAAILDHTLEWEQQYRRAREAVDQERWSDAVGPARRAAELYPGHVGADSPHVLLAQALDKLGRREEAITALQDFRRAGGWAPSALRDLGRWLDEAGRAREADEVLAALNYADPLNAEHHAQLGERLLAADDAEGALREFQVLLALSGHDPAPAYFGAARALRALGDREASRRRVLDALAVAPHFKPAQAFLLQIIQEANRNE
ncbi:MAG: tetratricopeptide repeat protein [Steroidobacteraceae bacterium]|nr:tetratricopeptide repeat protein [Steroidobacteraceae bacterium]